MRWLVAAGGRAGVRSFGGSSWQAAGPLASEVDVLARLKELHARDASSAPPAGADEAELAQWTARMGSAIAEEAAAEGEESPALKHRRSSSGGTGSSSPALGLTPPSLRLASPSGERAIPVAMNAGRGRQHGSSNALHLMHSLSPRALASAADVTDGGWLPG